jgi:hypothetical protein
MRAALRLTPAAMTARLRIRSTGRSRNGKEFLAALDDDANRRPPKPISPTDSCSAWTAKANKRVPFGYGLGYLIDIENAVIVDVKATPARTYHEVVATKYRDPAGPTGD